MRSRVGGVNREQPAEGGPGPRLGVETGLVEALFGGRFDARALGPFPTLSGPELELIDADLRAIRAGDVGAPGLARARRLGLLHGSELPLLLLARIQRELGARDLAAALCVVAHLALGARLVRRFGSESARRLLDAPESPVFAFALTEASPGSDLGQLQTYAEPEGEGFVLRGTKHWVTNAGGASHFIVLARLRAPAGGDKPRLTAFLVPRGPALVVTPSREEVLVGAEVGTLSLEGAFVGRDAVIGELGKGFRIVMHGLAEARLLVAAAVLGAGVSAFDATVDRLGRRRAFGRAVGHFPSVQSHVASMLGDLLALESLVFSILGRVANTGHVDPLEAAVARLVASRRALRVIDSCRELFGAAAFGAASPVGHVWTDARALMLLDGSDLALESFIALEGTRAVRREGGLGAEVGSALERIRDRSNALLGALGVRTHAGELATEQGELVRELGERVRRECERHGAELIERQHLQRRLAEIGSDLLTWHALAQRVIRERERYGEIGARRMSEAAELWLHAARERIGVALRSIDDNDDAARDRVAARAYADQAYPFDIL